MVLHLVSLVLDLRSLLFLLDCLYFVHSLGMEMFLMSFQKELADAGKE